MHFSQIQSNLRAEFEALAFEVRTLDDAFRQANFFGHIRNFPNAHYGYLMVCMSKIDLLSIYWRGEKGPSQTERMIAFMNQYTHPGKSEENRVAVQMFRHSLMHTGELRFLYNRTNNSAYTWRVHFGYSLPAGRHYSITAEDGHHQEILRNVAVPKLGTSLVYKSLNVGIVNLVEDLVAGLDAYLNDVEADAILQANWNKAHDEIVIQEVRF